MPAVRAPDDSFRVDDEFPSRRLSPSTPLAVAALLLVLAATGFAFLANAHVHTRDAEMRALRGQMDELQQQVAALGAKNQRISTRLNATNRTLKKKDAGIAPLAARILKSVFRVQTSSGWFGTGWAAWATDGQTYVITANHVVAHQNGGTVTLERGSGSWTGEIVKTDPSNDLALIRMDGHPKGAAPLWQSPKGIGEPHPGDQLLLAGSPYGLDGTVTTGIVSRVTHKVIQTDAAANPGNSGGPAVDKHGQVVGVLLAGGGENLNFAVPIARACDRLRSC
jgi:S1-C subfamily serine protease